MSQNQHDERVEVQSIVVNLSQPFLDLLYLLQVREKIDEIIAKLNLNIDREKNVMIFNLIKTLHTSEIGCSPLRTIINNFEEILSDGKIDATDIPLIIKTITDILNIEVTTCHISSITINDASILVKIIIQGLCDLNIIKEDPKKIIKIIESSISLLNTTLTVNKIATSVPVKKLFCCS
jgi:hypothetical protein